MASTALAIALGTSQALAEPPAAAPSTSAAPSSEARPWLAGTPTATTPAQTDSGGTRGLAWMLFGALAGAAGVVAWQRRTGAGQPTSAGGELSVVGATRVGPSSQLVLASVGGKRLLLAVTPQGVRKLHVLEGAAEPRAAAAGASSPRSSPTAATCTGGPTLRSAPTARAPRARPPRARAPRARPPPASPALTRSTPP
jgi:hypothetical protein